MDDSVTPIVPTAQPQDGTQDDADTASIGVDASLPIAPEGKAATAPPVVQAPIVQDTTSIVTEDNPENVTVVDALSTMPPDSESNTLSENSGNNDLSPHAVPSPATPTAQPVQTTPPPQLVLTTPTESRATTSEQFPQTEVQVPASTPAVQNPVAILKTEPFHTGYIPQKVLDLTPEELAIAHRLWAQRNIAGIRQKSLQARVDKKAALLTKIETIVKHNVPLSRRQVADKAHLSLIKTATYLHILVKSGRVRATGNTRNRKFS